MIMAANAEMSLNTTVSSRSNSNDTFAEDEPELVTSAMTIFRIKMTTAIHETSLSDLSAGNATSFNGQTTPLQLSLQICLVLAGFVAFASGGVVLYAMMTSSGRKKATNILIINQLILDMLSGFFLVVTFAAQFQTTYLSGSLGLFVCFVIQSELLSYVGMTGSTANLVMITMERYAKIVYPISHRKYFKPWMTYAAVAIAWLNGFLQNLEIFWTSVVIDGYCYPVYLWPSTIVQEIYILITLVTQYILPILMFIYLYGHIYVVIRRSNKVFQAPDDPVMEQSTQQTVTNNAGKSKSESKIIKTLLLVTVVFAVFWAPNQVFYTCYILFKIPWSDGTYLVTLLISCLTICVNPFIYATGNDDVKKRIAGWISASKSLISPSSAVQSNTRTTTTDK